MLSTLLCPFDAHNSRQREAQLPSVSRLERGKAGIPLGGKAASAWMAQSRLPTWPQEPLNPVPDPETDAFFSRLEQKPRLRLWVHLHQTSPQLSTPDTESSLSSRKKGMSHIDICVRVHVCICMYNVFVKTLYYMQSQVGL